MGFCCYTELGNVGKRDLEMKKKRVTKVVSVCEYICVNTTLNSTLYVTQNSKAHTNLFTPFKDLQVVLRLLSRLIETILSFVTKKNAGAGGIMPLENPLGLHLHQKGTENGKQWVIHRESPAACLAFKFRANVHVRVCVQSCESLSERYTSCVFRSVETFVCFIVTSVSSQSLLVTSISFRWSFGRNFHIL